MKFAILAEKRNYRSLLRFSKDLIVIPWMFLRLNLFRNPDNNALNNWLNVIVTLFASFDLRFASVSYIRKIIGDLCVKWGYTGLPGQSCPNLPELDKSIKKQKHPRFSKLSQYQESSGDRIGSILSYSGDVFNCNYGMNLDWLFKNNFVLELDGLFQHVKILIITFLLNYSYMSRLPVNNRDDLAKYLFLIDESQQIFTRNQELQEIPSLLNKFVAESRELKLSLIWGAQYIRDLPNSIVSSSATKIATGFADMRDRDEYCNAIGVKSLENRDYIGKVLEPGTALVFTPTYPDPFIIKVPYLGLTENISDEEVLERLLSKVDDLYHEKDVSTIKEAIRIHLGRPATASGLISPFRTSATGDIGSTNQRTTESIKPSTTQKPSTDKKAEELEEALRPIRLMMNRKHLYIHQTQLMKEAGITSGSKQNKIKKYLLRNGYISECVIRKGRSRIIFWKPTNKVLRLMNINQDFDNMSPDFLHRAVAKHKELSELENGNKVFLEWQMPNGKIVDMKIVKPNGEVVFIEIGMSSVKNELENAVAVSEQANELLFLKLIMACKNKKMKTSLEKLIDTDARLDGFRKKIEVVLAGEFIRVN